MSLSDPDPQTVQKERIKALAREVLGPGADGQSPSVHVVGDDGEVAVGYAHKGRTRCMVYVRAVGAMDAAEGALALLVRRSLQTGGG